MSSADLAIAIGTIIIFLQLLALTTELVIYLVMPRWYYYSAGPTIVRHRWQTRIAPADAPRVVEAALAGTKLVWRRHGTTFAVRRPWWEASAYPRITLTVEATAEGAALVTRVKPFVSGAFFLYPAFLTVPRMIGFSLFVSATCALMYVYFFAWEMRRLRALEILRERLGSLGVRACAKCGYDLYGLPDNSPCPECGTVAVKAATI